MAANVEAVKLRDIVRAKDPMTELCKNRLITSEACDWVKSALDPFHDLQLDSLRGYPDVSTEPTVVVKVRQAATITAPAGLIPGEPWDCHIALSPIDFSPALASPVRGARVTGIATLLFHRSTSPRHWLLPSVEPVSLHLESVILALSVQG